MSHWKKIGAINVARAAGQSETIIIAGKCSINARYARNPQPGMFPAGTNRQAAASAPILQHTALKMVFIRVTQPNRYSAKLGLA